MPTWRIDRPLLEEVDAEYATVEGGHGLVLRSWVVVVHEARLIVVRRVDVRSAHVSAQPVLLPFTEATL